MRTVNVLTTKLGITSSSAIAEGPRDALSQLKSCQLLHNCTNKKATFQSGSVPLRSDIKGTELPPANILIPLERHLIAL